MTARDLLLYTLRTNGQMLDLTLAAIDPSIADTEVHPNGFTATQTVNHLAECCFALKTMMEGGNHEWGNYAGPSGWEEAKADFAARRAELLPLCNSDDPQTLGMAMGYVGQHEQYHLGQLSGYLYGAKPDWNSHALYSVYEG